MEIVAQQNARSGEWIARQPDGMASKTGDTPEAAAEAYCELIRVPFADFEPFTPPAAPPHIRMFRRRAA